MQECVSAVLYRRKMTGVVQRKRSFTEKGREYEKEVAGKEIKKLRLQLSRQLDLFENLLKTKDVVSVEKEMENTDKVLIELQAQVARYIQACSEEETDQATGISGMLEAEEDGVNKVRTAVRTWLEAQNPINSASQRATPSDRNKENRSELSCVRSAEGSLDFEKETKEEKDQSNIHRTYEIMKIQLKLQDHSKLFHERIHMFDQERIIAELEITEDLYQEMKKKAMPLTNLLPDEERLKVFNVLENSEAVVQRMKGLGNKYIQVLQKEDDKRSIASKRSSRSEKRMKIGVKERRSLSVGGDVGKEPAKRLEVSKNIAFEARQALMIHLEEQINLVKNLTRTSNTAMMNREMEKLEQMYDEMKAWKEAGKPMQEDAILLIRKLETDVHTARKLVAGRLALIADTERLSKTSKHSKRSGKSNHSRRTGRSSKKSFKQDTEEAKVEAIREQLERNKSRLKEQRELVLKLLRGSDQEEIESEVEYMEKYHESTMENAKRLVEIVPIEEAKCICEQVVEEEKKLGEIKKEVVKWMVINEEEDKSVTTCSSRRTWISEITKSVVGEHQERQDMRAGRKSAHEDNEKKEYLRSENTKLWSRFQRQMSLCKDVLNMNNTEMLCREIHKLEDHHKDVSVNTLALCELIGKEEAEEVLKKVEEEENVIFEIKNKFVKQSLKQQLEKDNEKADSATDQSSKELAKIEGRLEDQKKLMEDLMGSKNVNLMDREMQRLDKVYDEFLSAASIQRKISPETGRRISRLLDTHDTSVFQIKKKITKWMTEQEDTSAELEEKDENVKEEPQEKSLTNENMVIAKDESLEVSTESKEEGTTESLIKLNELMVKTIRLQAAPKVEIDSFSGDPLEYDYFIQNFKDVVENLVEEPRQRFIRLLSHTEGEAKKLIRHCVHEDNKACYEKALNLLQKEYGDSFKVACAYLEKLNNWPQIKNNDAGALKELHRFLLQIVTYEKKGILSLDSPLTIRNVQLALPNNIQDKWTGRVGKIRKNRKIEASFKDFVEFVEEEASILNDPVYSRRGFKEKKEGLLKVCVTKERKIFCKMCSGNHDMDDCEEFKGKEPREKKDFLFRAKLCFSCFGDDHRAKECKNKRKCGVCDKEHPTSLHEVVFKVSALRKGSGDGGMCIVLVRMYHVSCPEKEIEVYALLDECSNGTFIHEKIADMLSDDVKRPTVVSVSSVNGDTTSESVAIQGLVVRGTKKFGDKYPTPEIALPTTFAKPNLPMDDDDIPRAEDVNQWGYLKEVAETLSEVKEMPLGLLIGTNCKKALEPLQVIQSEGEGPYAKRTRLGWCVIGAMEEGVTRTKCNHIRFRTPLKDVTDKETKSHIVFQTKITDDSIKNALQEMWKSDFIERDSEKKAMSKEDNYFLKLMQEKIKFKEGHYELPLPLRTQSGDREEDDYLHGNIPVTDEVAIKHSKLEVGRTSNRTVREEKQEDNYVILPNNRDMALQTLRYTKKKILRDGEFRKGYTDFMKKLIDKGYARKVPKERIGERAWYAPHHGVIHPVKKKVRPVFNCSAEKDGISLNKTLIQGPDPANSLIGVLLRFRKGKIAFTADIETMYYQVRIPEEHYKFLRFFWWESEDLSGDPDEFEMCVHPFGAVSSKSCVIFALHHTAFDNKEKYGKEAFETLLKEFYIDDLLKSMDTEENIIKLIKNLNEMCSDGGFNLTKYVCANTRIMRSIPVEKRAKIQETQEIRDGSTSENALGVKWLVHKDVLGFKVDFSTDDGTRRGCLSTLHRIKDPLGLAAPFLLKGRKILQKLAVEGGSWDKEISVEVKKEWNQWREELMLLNAVNIQRCYRSPTFGEATDVTLHCFSDASFVGYGVACYLRWVDKEGNIEVTLVMGKSRVSPMKPTTVPRLELTAATVAAKIAALLREELNLGEIETFYWVDNKIIIGYIYNKTRRYKIFVANRTNMIEEYTGSKNWRYVETKENPADFASRGISPKDKEKMERWLHGPQFLRAAEEDWRVKLPEIKELKDDVEVKTEKVVLVTKRSMLPILEKMEERISNWHRMKRVVAWIGRVVKKWYKKESVDMQEELMTSEIQEAETKLTRWVQSRSFEKEMKLVRTSKDMKPKKKVGNLWKLNPFLDEEGILRVGGRLCHAEETETFRFPIILPKKAIYSKRLIEWQHKRIEHRGKHSTIGELREKGYWVVNGSKEVGSVVYRCVRCKWLRGRLGGQKMANLPMSRVAVEPPFTYCGVDLFGPMKVKEGRKTVKRYGVLFTCLSMRAVHVEIAATLETDSFLMSLHRFIARRGTVREIRCDNATNFEGAENEVRKAVAEMDHKKIKEFMTEQGGDWVRWEKNTPHASHMGGAWERQIRTVKSVLLSLIKSNPKPLDEETLRTFLTEAEGIVNSRPLTIENLFDPESDPLCPSQILTMKSKLVLPPPGVFQEADRYCRKRWRIAQHLANGFWTRWRKEYLQLLQSRQKWTGEKRNLKVDDVVLLKDEGVVRSQWPMGRVIEVHESKDGLVRSVTIKTKTSTFKRPVTKTILLVAADDTELPPTTPQI